MAENPIAPLEACFGDMPDPRVVGRCEHRLIDIVMIALCAVITGAETWVEVETFGQKKQAWLEGFLALPNGVPSHDTFGRVFAALDGKAFHQRFVRWVHQVFGIGKGQVVAVDGKTVRGSHARRMGKGAIHLVSAWASESGVTLGQLQVAEKSNEIPAIPQLLRLLDVSGCVVTVDAMGCQTQIAQAIRDEGAEYVLRVKDNHAHLHQDLQDWFAYADEVGFASLNAAFAETINKDHGRLEIRRCWAISDPLAFEYIRHFDGWADLQTIVRVVRERRLPDGTQTSQTAFYISSLPHDAERLLAATRNHWAIENSCHWVLDVTFAEDASRIRTAFAPHNMALLRRMALNLLKRDPSKGSLRQKRYQAALDDNFLLHLLHSI